VPLKISRGQVQSLFRYLPQQLYNWPNRQGTFRGTDDVDSRPLDMPVPWIKRSLRHFLNPWGADARRQNLPFPGLELIERDRFVLLEPRKFRGEFFPRTYVCPSCDLFISTDDPPSQIRCSRGHGQRSAEQWSFVEFHGCGHLSGMAPPSCDNRCGRGMKLHNRASRSISDWQWRCSVCNTAARTVYRQCPSCHRGTVNILRAEANAVFYPQSITVVNAPHAGDYALLDNEMSQLAAIAQVLGVLPPGLDGIRQALNSAGGSAGEAQIRAQLIRDFGFEDGSPEMAAMLRRRREHANAQTDWQDSVESLGLDPEIKSELGYECLALTLAHEAAPVTMTDLVNQAASPALRTNYEIEYPALLTNLGFSEITLLREFPIAHLVPGFTRQSRLPEDGVQFRFFSGSEAGTIPIYGKRMETEGLLFRLNPAKVVRWLVESGAVEDPGAVNPQAWLLRVLQPIESVFDPPDDRLTSAVLGLLHSVSHRVLRAVGVRSGLSTESLSEFLIPRALTFIIHAGSHSEFVLGGLEHVFRNSLADSLSNLRQDRRCVFDPPCRHTAGGCSFCMYLSETSCQRFNTSLSRSYLFGGELDGIRWEGYWNT